MIGDGRPLRMYWSKRERDMVINYPRRCDGSLMNHWLSHTDLGDIVKELDKRGYDVTTLRFSIKQKVERDINEDQKPAGPEEKAGA